MNTLSDEAQVCPPGPAIPLLLAGLPAGGGGDQRRGGRERGGGGEEVIALLRDFEPILLFRKCLCTVETRFCGSRFYA